MVSEKSSDFLIYSFKKHHLCKKCVGAEHPAGLETAPVLLRVCSTKF